MPALLFMKVMICDPISPKGIALFKQQPGMDVVVLEKPLPPEQLIPLLKDVDALIVRSETKVRRNIIDAAPKLRVVGRAGVGVDNVDTEYATERGVVVMNTPAGNTISTAELAFSMMVSMARKIPQAHMSMKSGEWNRKAFQGSELSGKTLGVMGMGRIGAEVAKRAMAFNMRVMAYDPYLNPARAEALGVKLGSMDEVFGESDYLTLHMTLTDETKGILNATAFAKMKKGIRIINCARGPLINEKDLYEALKSGQVGGAALDVFETEPPPKEFPLRDLPQVVMTPHLGASTEEAQENVGIEVAEIVSAYLTTGAVQNAVNLPNLDAKTYATVKPYLDLGRKLGHLVAQMAPKQNDRLVITYGGNATKLPADPITRAVLQGFLEPSRGKDVNQVNVRSMAQTAGLLVEEIKSNEATDYSEWLHVSAFSGEQRASAGGTFYGKNPRIVRIASRPVEVNPSGVLFIFNNKDRPGIVGYIGTLMGRHNVNIASMSLSRDEAGGRALTVLNLDSVPGPDVMAEIAKDPDISDVKVVKL
jgi:D-3-phosphoglycerate dehydrogenase